MRDSFILYTEQRAVLKKMAYEDIGKLFMAIYDYQATGEVPELDEKLSLLFETFKVTLDRNEEKWKIAKEKRSIAGKKGMAVRWSNITKDNNVISDITNDNNDNNVIDDITKITSITDNVNVNVNVNDNNIVNKKTRKQFVAPTLDEVREYVNTKGLNVDAKVFFDYFTEGGWKDSKGNKVKNWKQKLITWNRYSQKTDTKEYQKEQLDLSGLYDN